METIEKRKFRQRMQNATDEQFWREMNQLHSRAYFMAVKHYTEASEIVLPPRYQQPLHDKAIEIREQWDGIREINVEETAECIVDESQVYGNDCTRGGCEV